MFNALSIFTLKRHSGLLIFVFHCDADGNRDGIDGGLDYFWGDHIAGLEGGRFHDFID